MVLSNFQSSTRLHFLDRIMMAKATDIFTEAGWTDSVEIAAAPNRAAFLFNIAQRSDRQRRIDYVGCWQVTHEEHWSPIGHVLAQRVLTALCYWSWWPSIYKLSFTPSVFLTFLPAPLPLLHLLFKLLILISSSHTCKNRPRISFAASYFQPPFPYLGSI